MPPVIYLVYEPAEGEPKSYRFRSGMFTAGRDAGNDILVPSSSVSRQHAKFVPCGSHWVFFDLESTNGSWLNDQQMEPNRPTLLRHGDELILADARFAIRIRAEEGNPLPRYRRSLLVFEDDKFHSEFPLERAENVFTVGGQGAQFRVPNCPVELALEISNQEGKIVAKPVAGFAGTERNGSQIIEPTTLEDGDVLTIFSARLLVNENERTIVGDTDAEAPQNVVDRGPVVESPAGETLGISTPREWGSDADRRGTEGKGRRFVFGEKEERVDPNSTVLSRPVPSGRKRTPTDFDMNISRRVSSVPFPGERTASQEKQRRIVIGILFIAGSFVLALVAVVAGPLQ